MPTCLTQNSLPWLLIRHGWCLKTDFKLWWFNIGGSRELSKNKKKIYFMTALNMLMLSVIKPLLWLERNHDHSLNSFFSREILESTLFKWFSRKAWKVCYILQFYVLYLTIICPTHNFGLILFLEFENPRRDEKTKKSELR